MAESKKTPTWSYVPVQAILNHNYTRRGLLCLDRERVYLQEDRKILWQEQLAECTMKKQGPNSCMLVI